MVSVIPGNLMPISATSSPLALVLTSVGPSHLPRAESCLWNDDKDDEMIVWIEGRETKIVTERYNQTRKLTISNIQIKHLDESNYTRKNPFFEKSGKDDFLGNLPLSSCMRLLGVHKISFEKIPTTWSICAIISLPSPHQSLKEAIHCPNKL